MHGTDLGIDLQLHALIGNVDDDGLLVSLFYQKRRTVDTVQELPLVDGNLRLVIAGEHLVNAEIFALDEAGNHYGIVEFKYDMVGGEEQLHRAVRFAG